MPASLNKDLCTSMCIPGGPGPQLFYPYNTYN